MATDAEANKCLQDPARPTPQDQPSLRSKFITPGTDERNRLCHFIVKVYDKRGNRDGLNFRRLTTASTLRDTIAVIVSEYAELAVLTIDDLDSIEAAIVAYFSKREVAQRVAALHTIAGKRLARCTLDNYVTTLPSQQKVLAELRDYAKQIQRMVSDGVGIVINGPSGNGKDHILFAVARCAVESGLVVAWLNGQDLLAAFRERIGTDKTEDDLLGPLIAADVLAISDPLPPSGSLTDYQAGMIYRVLDSRYRDCKATWATMNATSRQEADARLGVQIVDRLRHGALCLACNWPSYRQARNHE